MEERFWCWWLPEDYMAEPLTADERSALIADIEQVVAKINPPLERKLFRTTIQYKGMHFTGVGSTIEQVRATIKKQILNYFHL